MTTPFELFEYKHLFNDALAKGINLFCGAGFSVEASDTAKAKLPIGSALLDELKVNFPSISSYTSLPRACTKLERSEKEDFYLYLKNRFSVSDFSSLYKELTNINVKKIYTTNIDNLFFKIFENSGDRLSYLNDVSINGTIFNDNNSIDYFPLHGCVQNNSEHYVFGVTELASAFSQRGTEKTWESLARDASNNPILFWGWNFEDSGPIEAMYGNGNDISSNISRWVLLYEPNDETIDFLRSLNFNIIIGNTMQMLEYLKDFNETNTLKDANTPNELKAEELSNYLPPKNDEKLTAYPLSAFFVDYTPRWSHIYSNKVPRTIYYKKVSDYILSRRNVIVIGIRGSGKTTLMMQLLINLRTDLPKHFLVAPSLEQAKTYIKILNGAKSILFVDDCFRDTNAMLELLWASNVQAVCFDRDFNYERQYHRIKAENFKFADITEINREDAQSIIDIIPNELKKGNATTRNFEKDKTIPNLLASSLKAVNFNFIRKFFNKDPVAADVFLMICYVHACGVPCSFDMVYSYLGDDRYNWQEMMDAVTRAGGLVKDLSDVFGSYDVIDSLQNYYQCRSRFFAEKIIKSIPEGNETFANVLLDFAQYVPPYKICMYDKFKRGGYDADYSTKAFPNVNDGEHYYNICLKKDDSEYIYQQAAIYFSRKEEYKKAFDWIDMARNLAHYNRFSIDSTYAKIYFDVNLNADQIQSQKALDILRNCCSQDKRKFIHFLTFANCSLKFHEKYNDDLSYEYIQIALDYVNEGLKDTNLALSQINKWALKDVKSELLTHIKD